ncbi:Transposase and inactivated derivatives [uncultured Ruminococcus sp.]|nr:Transposase and inactivated derivatives [uncultured Ruminococcus sp.]
MKMRFKRFLSGFMAVATLASTIIQPVTVSASELEPEKIPFEQQYAELKDVQDSLDPNEIVKANDIELSYIRRIMYTTNIIEGLNRQYRKVTKTKSVFPSDTALEKMLYLASENVVRKWTQRYRNWDQVLNQLIVLYGERLTNCL